VRSLSALLLAALASVDAVAEDPPTLPEVAVNASHRPAAFANVSYVDRQELVGGERRELNQVLQGYPSVNMPRGMKGGFTTLTLRGAGGSLGLVNIDGIPLQGKFVLTPKARINGWLAVKTRAYPFVSARFPISL